MSLRDLIPVSLKEDLADNDIRVGTVLDMFDEETTPPKYKWHIFVGITSDRLALATVYINTQINTNFINSRELVNLQYKISAGPDRPFLQHDSYVDCSKIKHKNVSIIRELIKEKPNCVLGYVPKIDEQAIISLVKGADTIAPYDKKLYNLI